MSVSDTYRHKILSLREQAAIKNDWLKQRLDTVIPEIMAREDFDMWLVIAREYNEDPVIMTLLPAPAMAARRRTILMFHRKNDDTVDRFTLSRYGMKGYYEARWNPDEESQFECLARMIKERDPKTLGLNFSEHFAFGDGLSHQEYSRVAAALGDDIMSRVRSATRLCVGWLERRIELEMTVYPHIVEIGHAIIAEAYSSRVITPGITTTDDVVWWMRQKMHDMGLQAWFQPSVELQAHGTPFKTLQDRVKELPDPRKVILPGDLLHCDMGFYYHGLATDQQQHAYVLKPGETDVPAGLKAALADGNRLQDILLEEMVVGRSGNEVLKNTRERAVTEGIQPSVYTHPLGYHGHAAGPTIGLWDMQDGVPGNGDYELFDDTCYSIELNVVKKVPDWDGQDVRIMLEEDAVLTGGKVRYLHGRQTEFHLIG
jgi:hypothetical protein